MSRITSDILAAARKHADALGIELAAMLAVIEIESAFQVYAVVGDKKEPVIRWEGHYFDRRLSGAARERARREGFAHPNAGAILNPRAQSARWALLTRAAAINAEAAFESVSYGAGQVMGAHWEWLGYSSVANLVNVARSGVDGQIELMARFIDKAGLKGALKRRDWAAFARGYNGPAYARNAYHTKLADAYQRHVRGLPITASADRRPSAEGMLRLASTGARVRELQQLLVRAGYPLKVDGDFGPATHAAVFEFQQRAGLEVDGVAGPLTMKALDKFRQGPADQPGALAVSQVPEVQNAGKSAVAVGLVTTARDQIAETATALVGIEADTAQLVANAMLAGAGIIGVGLTIWAVVGVLRSRETVEVPS